MIRDYTRRAYQSSQEASSYAVERDLGMEQLEQFFLGGYGVNAQTNMHVHAGGQNISAPTSGVVHGSYIWLQKGMSINRIAIYTRGTAGATLTHRWAALWAIGGASLARQSTDNTGASMTANTLFEFVLSSAYSVPASGAYPVGVCIVGTTIPTLSGASLGIAALSAPSLTGFTLPKRAWTSGSGLLGTAPASISPANIVNEYQFFVY